MVHPLIILPGRFRGAHLVTALHQACTAGCFPRAKKIKVNQFCFIESWKNVFAGNSSRGSIPDYVLAEISKVGTLLFASIVLAKDCLRDRTWRVPTLRLSGNSHETFIFHRDMRYFVDLWWVAVYVAEDVV